MEDSIDTNMQEVTNFKFSGGRENHKSGKEISFELGELQSINIWLLDGIYDINKSVNAEEGKTLFNIER